MAGQLEHPKYPQLPKAVQTNLNEDSLGIPGLVEYFRSRGTPQGATSAFHALREEAKRLETMAAYMEDAAQALLDAQLVR